MSQIGISFVADQLKCAFDGEAWHGPALMEILNGVDARTAAARPIGDAHSIWELVLHLAGWERVVMRRLGGERAELSDAENFPQISVKDDKAWREAVESLRRTHNDLIGAVSALNESQLSGSVPDREYDTLFMLTGVAQHAAYHGGQIALLKKAAARE